MPMAAHPLAPALLALALYLPGLSLAQAAAGRSAPAQPSSAAAARASAPALSAAAHEQQLQAIRQALIEATTQAPTQVIASSWLDDMGALRESHQFNSKAEVRSVRLLPWDHAETPSETPRASAEVLPWGWRQDAQAAASCTPAPRAWRVPLVLSAQRASGFPGEQAAASQTVLQATLTQVQRSLQNSARWSAGERALSHRNSYWRALAEPARDEAAAWQLDIRLEPLGASSRRADEAGTGEPSSTRWLGTTTWTWLLRLQLTQSDKRTQWQQEWRIAMDPEQLAQHPSQWRGPLEAALAERVSAWLGSVERQLECDPVQFVVRSQPGGALQLLAGAHSGLRPGDRVLIMQPGWVPSRVLDPRAADHLALAEVVSLSAQRTEIRQLAGPPLPPGSDWVALPL